MDLGEGVWSEEDHELSMVTQKSAVYSRSQIWITISYNWEPLQLNSATASKIGMDGFMNAVY